MSRLFFRSVTVEQVWTKPRITCEHGLLGGVVPLFYFFQEEVKVFMKSYGDALLLTPGPTSLPRRVLDAYARPILHHRTEALSQLLVSVLDDLRWLFATDSLVLPIHTTGRGAMEAALTNTLHPGDTVISFSNGKFSTIFGDIAVAYGLNVQRICTDWTAPPRLEELEHALEQHPHVRAVTVCHNETSTAVMLDIAEIAKRVHAHGALLLVDAVSSAGCARIDFDECGADVLVTCSQKGLMCTTGMAFALLSERAWIACEQARLPYYYTDFKEIRKCITSKNPETPGSTPVSAFYGLHEALTMMREEGREQLFARHEVMARAIRAMLQALSCPLIPVGLSEAERSHSVTAFLPPTGLSAKELKKEMEERYGLTLASGMGVYTDKALRIGHMGYFFERDALMLAACLEACFAHHQVLQHPGAGVEAVVRACQL